jgi:hypothetical protein
MADTDRTIVPAVLRARLAADYAPVRPLPSPARRALALVPFALLTLVAAQAFFEMRLDAPRLGWNGTWGLSIAQIALAIAVAGVALRESVPGRGLSRAASGMWIVLPVLFVIAVTAASWALSPTHIRGSWLLVSSLCLISAVVSALPAVALGSVLAGRAYPTRPHLVGALVGLAAGLMADAGWRLFCHFSEPAHVLTAHLGGVLVATGVGLLLTVSLSQEGRRA